MTNDDVLGLRWEQILMALWLPSSFKHRSTGVIVGYCVFHTEKTPSLHLWPDSGRFRCHGCGVKGGMLDFINLYTGEDPDTVADFIASLPPLVQKGQLAFPFYRAKNSAWGIDNGY